MNADRTGWFDGKLKPAQPGVYEREWPNVALFARWDGTAWMYSSYNQGVAEASKNISACQHDIRWRGLAQEPKA